MVSLLSKRASFESSSPVPSGFFGVALILISNGVPDSAKPWPARSLPAALGERALARLRKLLIVVPAAVQTGPQRWQRSAELDSLRLFRFLAGFAANHADPC